MKTYQIELLEPDAERLLQELARLKLIRFQEISSPSQNFLALLSDLRENEDDSLDMEDISKEVEIVRAKRYKK